MKLVCLGTNGFLPTETAQTACYFLPEMGIALDAGSGLQRLHRFLCTDSMDIYITHAHGDHTSGLEYLFAAYFAAETEGPAGPLSAASLRECMRRALDRLSRTRIHALEPVLESIRVRYPSGMELCPLRAHEALPGGGTLTSFALEHGGTACAGFRLDWPGHSLAYVSDTVARTDAPYVETITGVDLLLHECNGPSREAEMVEMIHHSHTEMVARVARRAQAGRLVLIHKCPLEPLADLDLPAAQAIFPGAQIAEDWMEIDF